MAWHVCYIEKDTIHLALGMTDIQSIIIFVPTQPFIPVQPFAKIKAK